MSYRTITKDNENYSTATYPKRGTPNDQELKMGLLRAATLVMEVYNSFSSVNE
jgi:hypothetical protein